MRVLSVGLLWSLTALSLLAGNPANPILFVTQVPMPEEVNSRDVVASYQSCVSPFSNHLGDTAHAGRGGSLEVRFSNGQVVDLLAVADWSAIPGGKPASNTVAVRNPSVNWTADKALFSMVIGAPSGPADTTTFLWQLYEITLPTQSQLNASTRPVLTKVANQPAFNNVFPCYGLGGKIVFASDRPYNGQAHLTQREEYLGLPTVSGLWSLDPADASSIQILQHSPSGAFSPMVDSAGRLIFTNWDHLSRDSEAVTDSRNGVSAPPYNESFTQTANGSGNFADESAGAAFTQVTAMPPNTWEIFPEPRNFDKKSLIDDFGNKINGNTLNIFLPWMVNLDGSGLEIVNHAGRHELAGPFLKNFKNDAALADLNPGIDPGYGGMGVRKFFGNFMWTREDPLNPGAFYGSDAADLGTHGAGQIVCMNNGGAGLNPDLMTVSYITGGANNAPKPGFIPAVRQSINLPPTGQPALSPANAETLYRTPVALADGNLIASHVGSVTQTDYNVGTQAQPASLYAFRLMSLKASGAVFVPDVTLTTGLTINTSYYVGPTLVSYHGPAWELDPAEVAPRTVPLAATSAIDPIEAGVFAANGVDVPTFQKYLRSINAALSVSRDVTRRDRHDRQQPFNLKITWSNTQTTVPGTAGLYTVGWIQFLQADLRRGYLLGGSTPAAGRRVVATPLHDTISENVAAAGAPAGALRLGDDGSFAAIIPAGKAMTWHLLDDDAAKTSQVKERFWVTFQRGEIRTCANCHGINTADQAGATKPVNPPAALAALLQFWKGQHPAGALQLTTATAKPAGGATSLSLNVSRTGGSVGPVRVNFSTVDGTATAGADFTAPVNGQLSWADGDTADKTITIPLLANAAATLNSSFSVVLSNPLNGSLGGQTTAIITLTATPAALAKVLAVSGLHVTNAAAGSNYSALKSPASGPFTGSVLTGKKATPAIFATNGSVMLQNGGASSVLPGVTVAKLLAFNGDAALVQLALTPGSVTAADDTVIIAGLSTGQLRLAARENRPLTNASSLAVKSFGTIDGNGATVFFLAKLQGSGVDPTNDSGLCAALSDGTVRLLARKGQPLGNTTVASLATLVGVKGFLAEGRWRLDDHTVGTRITDTEGNHLLYSIPDSASTTGDWILWAGTGDTLTSAPAGAKLTTIGLPGFGSNGPAFLAHLLPGTGSVMLPKAAGIFRADNGGLSTLALAGVTGATFKTLSDPVSGAGKKTAFLATLANTSPALASGIWYAADGLTATPLAMAGQPAAGGGKWAAFQALVLPDGATSGPVFLATLALDKNAGITAKTNAGLWALDGTGVLQRLLHTGEGILVNGNVRSVQSFVALRAASGSIGAANGYGDTHVTVLATFVDKTVALIDLPIP
ncbi:MAG: hypothetical protein QOE70_1973 [Chthoniobacter sp.]|jgi:hypothetical protein|nr:hypothetical protein [Chthoniobacter sp.]